jgi:hypothetical protein
MYQFFSKIEDKVVNGSSYLVTMTVREYISLARTVIKKNEFQRKRVRSSKTTYSLLRKDLKTGCAIPPIVLAYRNKTLLNIVNGESTCELKEEDFIILDGLQRSFTLIDLCDELQGNDLNDFLERTVRCEVYDGVNRAGILYRMLTLNTGQTTMSLRHQIEMMYLDYLDVEIEGVRLIREVNGTPAKKIGEYNFKEMVEAFNSYIERNELPMDRGDVLDNIAGLENLSIERNDVDLFGEFMKALHSFILRMNQLDIALDEVEDGEEEIDAVWAHDGVRIFKRPQAMSGFGAALGLLRQEGEFNSFSDICELSKRIEVGSEKQQFAFAFNEAIADINKEARKIGNAQRLFFRVYFKMLFMRESGGYLNLNKCIPLALNGARRLGI